MVTPGERMTEASSTLLLQKLDSYIHCDKRELVFPKVLNEFSALRDQLKTIIPFLTNDVLDNNDDRIVSLQKELRNAVYDVEDEAEKMMRSPKLWWGCHSRLPFWWHLALSKHLNGLHKVRRRIQMIMDEVSKLEIGGLERGGSSISPDEHHRKSMLGISDSSWDSEMVGFDDYRNKLEQLLLEDRDKQLKVISVTGLGGIGKTTLVKNVYNSTRVKSIFECYTWVYISQSFKTRDVLRELLNGFFFGTAPYALDSMNEEELLGAICSYLRGKRYLLVLDDVWDITFWEILAPNLPKDCGGRIIVTSRSEDLVKSLHVPYEPFPLKPLKYDDSLALFFQNLSLTGPPPPQLLAMAKDLVGELEGLPLAIILLAKTLRGEMNPRAWERAMLLLKEPVKEDNLGKILMDSYRSLTYPVRLLFLSLSLFPEDEEIGVKRFLRLWVAEGFVDETPVNTAEEVAENYFKELILRSMIAPVRIDAIGNVKSCNMHDLLRDLSLVIIEKNNFREFYTNGRGNYNQNLRRMSIFGNTENMTSHKSDIVNIRSFAVSGSETVPSSLMDLLPSKLELLRVLDLGGVHIKILPSGLATLFHLRYLGLRRTHIIELPASLSRLRHLRTLDIRDTQVRRLPRGLIGIVQLRHIHLVGSFMTKVVELELPVETGYLIAPQIQTLAGVSGTTRLVQELQRWTQLRKLSIGRVTGNDSENLCASINKMSFLRSLSIKCDAGESLQMESLSSPLCSNNLETLRIGGRVKPFAHLVHCFPYLCRLYLWDNMLKEDPFSSLQPLPNLIVLSLSNAYIGKKMECCAEGFPKLKNLHILRMSSLECGTIEVGGMQKLDYLFIGHCPNLKKPFQGLIELPLLNILKVSEMADEFVKVIEEYAKDHHFKVQYMPLFVNTV